MDVVKSSDQSTTLLEQIAAFLRNLHIQSGEAKEDRRALIRAIKEIPHR